MMMMMMMNVDEEGGYPEQGTEHRSPLGSE